MVNYALLFLAGALLCNCIPHLVAALQGKTFPTPFSRPRGVGKSNSITNLFWGFCNLAVGSLIVNKRAEHQSMTLGLMTLSVGFLIAGMYISVHFSKMRRPGDSKPTR